MSESSSPPVTPPLTRHNSEEALDMDVDVEGSSSLLLSSSSPVREEIRVEETKGTNNGEERQTVVSSAKEKKKFLITASNGRDVLRRLESKSLKRVKSKGKGKETVGGGEDEKPKKRVKIETGGGSGGSGITSVDGNANGTTNGIASGTKPPGRFKTRGKLASLLDLPLDILLEVFGNLGLQDLLHLSRTTKAFRSVVLARNAISVWRSALRGEMSSGVEGSDVDGGKAMAKEGDDIPACPEDMSIPAYASLLFDSFCHNCLAKNIKTVEWMLRKRFCAKCLKNSALIFTSDQLDGSKKLHQLIARCVPFQVSKGVRGCLVADKEAFQEELKKREGEEDRNAWVEERAAEVTKRRQHMFLCEKWLKKQVVAREDELKKIQNERQKFITAQLEELGYEKELEYLRNLEDHKMAWKKLAAPIPPSYELKSYGDHPEVRVSKPISERVWATRVRPIMEEYMDKVREYRVVNDRNLLIAQRRHEASEIWMAWRVKEATMAQFPANAFGPNVADFLEWERVQYYVEHGEEKPKKNKERGSLWAWCQVEGWDSDGDGNENGPSESNAKEKKKLSITDSDLENFVESWPRQHLQKLTTVSNFASLAGTSYGWRFEVDSSLRAQACGQGQQHNHRAWNPYGFLDLAVLVFTCKQPYQHLRFLKDENPNFKDWDFWDTKCRAGCVMWFPEHLEHACHRVRERSWDERIGRHEPNVYVPCILEHGPSSSSSSPTSATGLEREDRIYQRVAFRFDHMKVHWVAGSVVKRVILACGMKSHWSDVTTQEMDELDARVVCLKCSFGARCDGERRFVVMNWRAAVKHALKAHNMDPAKVTSYSLP